MCHVLFLYNQEGAEITAFITDYDQKRKKNSIIWTILRLALLYNSENLEIIKMNKICALLLTMKLYMEHTNIQSINCFHLTLYLRGIVNIIKKDAQYNIVKHIKNMCNMTLFLFKLRQTPNYRTGRWFFFSCPSLSLFSSHLTEQ